MKSTWLFGLATLAALLLTFAVAALVQETRASTHLATAERAREEGQRLRAVAEARVAAQAELPFSDTSQRARRLLVELGDEAEARNDATTARVARAAARQAEASVHLARNPSVTGPLPLGSRALLGAAVLGLALALASALRRQARVSVVLSVASVLAVVLTRVWS